MLKTNLSKDELRERERETKREKERGREGEFLNKKSL